MRLLLALAASLLLPLAAAGTQPPGREEERFTPEDIWEDAWSRRFHERWFGGQLRAMGEPVLAGPEDLGRFRSRLRLLVLPNSEPGFAVRVDERRSGEAVLSVVELDGAGGYAPGSVARRHRSALAADDVAALRSELERIRFSALPGEEPPPPPMECDTEADECTIYMCLHPTTFVFEWLDRRGRRFVERSCRIEPEFERLIDLLVPLRERN